MSWVAILKVLPQIISLLMAIARFISAAHERKVGRDEAALKALELATAAVERANQIRAEAEKEHANHPADDGGFDSDFKRAD